MRQHGLLRPLTAADLSDGTLRYFLLVAALLSPRPPELMVLNEPEGSLHPDLLAPLARLVEQAAKRSQIIVVTHAAQLVSELATAPTARLIRLEKQFGETMVEGDARPKWSSPSRGARAAAGKHDGAPPSPRKSLHPNSIIQSRRDCRFCGSTEGAVLSTRPPTASDGPQLKPARLIEAPRRDA
jgi:hypothetical protein